MSIPAVKMLMKAVGLDANAIETKALDVQKVILEFDLNELKAGLQTIVDYRKDQAQNQLRLIAIMNALNVVDPIMLSQITTETEGDENGSGSTN